MKQLLATVILLITTTTFSLPSEDFLHQQKRYERVKIAFDQKDKLITNSLVVNKIDKDHLDIILVAYKEERTIEIWGKNDNDTEYKLITKYPFCFYIGKLGPKRTLGDRQIPEGLYYISMFNPKSDYYLSLKVSYPNKSDSILGTHGRLGGDIYIHGGCVTIGCIPITDDKIKELYLYAVYARNNGGNIPVYIFPFKMDDNKLNSLQNNKYYSFWKNLKTGYDIFNLQKSELIYDVNSDGKYIFN
jgi:murein L,D-transpeptidase YafK